MSTNATPLSGAGASTTTTAMASASPVRTPARLLRPSVGAAAAAGPGSLLERLAEAVQALQQALDSSPWAAPDSRSEQQPRAHGELPRE